MLNMVTVMQPDIKFYAFQSLLPCVKIYHLYSHIFRPEFMKYNSNYTRAESLMV